jgi:hypothetical protein
LDRDYRGDGYFSENAVRLVAHIIPITMYTHIRSLILGVSNSTSRSPPPQPTNQPTALAHQSPQRRPPARLSSTPFSHCTADKQQTLHPSKRRTPAKLSRWHPDRRGAVWATSWYCRRGYRYFVYGLQCHVGSPAPYRCSATATTPAGSSSSRSAHRHRT